MFKRMKSIFCLIICLVLIFGVVGCGKKVVVPEGVDQPDKTELSAVEKIMKEYNASMFAKDVEFDIENNLDKNFFIYGTAELSNYYNYGFSEKNKKDWFCIKITPMFETSKDSWYLYDSRKVGKKLYDILVKNGSVDIAAICVIPNANYQSGQTNMAKIIYSSWKK